jgi:hypothetical protein
MTTRIFLKSAVGMALAAVIGTASVNPARAGVVVDFTFGDIGATLNGANPASSTIITVSGAVSGTGIFPLASDPSHSLVVDPHDTTGFATSGGNGLVSDPVTTSVAAFPLSPGIVNFYKYWWNGAHTIYYQVDFTSLVETSIPTATGYTGTYYGELYEGASPTGLTDTGEKDTMAMSIVDNVSGNSISVEFADSTIPEPVSLAVFGMGVLGLGLVRRSRA